MIIQILLESSALMAAAFAMDVLRTTPFRLQPKFYYSWLSYLERNGDPSQGRRLGERQALPRVYSAERSWSQFCTREKTEKNIERR